MQRFPIFLFLWVILYVLTLGVTLSDNVGTYDTMSVIALNIILTFRAKIDGNLANPPGTKTMIEVQDTTDKPKSQYKFRIGIYGWRKRCLYILILGLLVMVTINLALTLWILNIMEFSSVSFINHSFYCLIRSTLTILHQGCSFLFILFLYYFQNINNFLIIYNTILL